MKFIIILLLATLTTGCGYDKYAVPEEAIITTKDDPIEVYSDVSLYDLIGENNVEVLTENKLVETDTVGEKSERITYRFDKREYYYDVKYTVSDTTPPIFISVSSSKTVLKNTETDFCANAVYADNYDATPTCEIEGSYDLSKTGIYEVSYVIKDTSDNATKRGLKINVVDKISSSGNHSSGSKTHLDFKEAIKMYKTDDTEVGIDISRWQGDIDFNKVAEAGVEFVIMRIGVQTDSDKEISMDSYYERNIKGAKEAGLKVGVYVYTTAVNKELAVAHAKWVVDILNGTPLDFPIAYDWENWSKFKKYQINLNDFSNCFNYFYDEVKKHGYDAMLYSSKFYLENVWINKNNRDVWLAHYTSKTSYSGDYILWQLSNVGRVDGITGDVDIDVYYHK